jgi:hypothetical protein
MPSAATVAPKKWTNTIILYDNGYYSAIWGSFDGGLDRCLGVRWNGEVNDVGYPNQGGNPLWYVEPKFLTEPILLSLLSNLIDDKSINNREEYKKNILLALDEFKQSVREKTKD